MTALCVGALVCFGLGDLLTAQERTDGASPAWVVGNPNAPVSLEVFDDYQCPFCATFSERLKTISEKYQDSVSITFRNFPLTQTHRNALRAAQAAEAAGLQGRFLEMVNLLFANQRAWGDSDNARELFVSYAKRLNLDVKRFAGDFAGKEAHERIARDVRRANFLKVARTPTVFLNGKEVTVEAMSNIEQLIDDSLNRSKH